jgi:predicted dehydrogenase
MPDKVRIGLIGFGNWTRHAYVPALLGLPSTEVTAVAAKSAASRKAAQETLGPHVATFSDFHSLIARAETDALMIALPGDLHAAAVLAGIDAGRAVFFEPPLALTRTATESALDKVAAASQVVQCDLELRYLPVMDAVVDLIRKSAIGNVRFARVSVWGDWGRNGALLRFEKDGLGYALSPWYLDVLDAVIPEMPEQVQVTGGRAFNGELIDHGWVALRYRGGQVGCFEMNLLAPGGTDVRLCVVGEDGEIRADLLGGTFRWRATGGAWQEGSAPPSLPECGFVGMRECVAAFADAVRKARPSRTTLDVLRRVHEAMILCAENERN